MGDNARRFTVLWAAESEGPIETRFASTLDHRIDLADRELLAGAVGTPPHRRRGCRRRRVRRATRSRDDAMYICADSLRDVDGATQRRSLLGRSRRAPHTWRGDLVVIDNHQTLHKRVPYDHASQRRLRGDARDAYVV